MAILIVIDKFINSIEKLGFDPIVVLFIIMLVMDLNYIKYLDPKKYKKLSKIQKVIVRYAFGSTIIIFIVLVLKTIL